MRTICVPLSSYLHPRTGFAPALPQVVEVLTVLRLPDLLGYNNLWATALQNNAVLDCYLTSVTRISILLVGIPA